MRGVADFIGGKSWLFVLAAVVLLGMVWWLDAHGYYGIEAQVIDIIARWLDAHR